MSFSLEKEISLASWFRMQIDNFFDRRDLPFSDQELYAGHYKCNCPVDGDMRGGRNIVWACNSGYWEAGGMHIIQLQSGGEEQERGDRAGLTAIGSEIGLTRSMP